MLAEIGAPERLTALQDPGDPRFRSGDDVRLVFSGASRRELFRVLEFALSARFADTPRAVRIRDLLGPLRHALGNAYKHGNRRERGKRIDVEILATRRGAVVTIGDEGNGFDVSLAVQRLRGEERGSTRRGAGLRALDDARSAVAYEAGGRIVLIRFLASSRPSSAAAQGRLRLDAARMVRGLADELRGFSAQEDPTPLELCGVAADGEDGSEPARIRCLLSGRRAGGVETRILCGRLFATAGLADADLAAAAALRERVRMTELRVPRPMPRLRSEPKLALYDFDPWLDLGEYLAQRGSGALPSVAGRIGAWLAALHQSRIDFAQERWEVVLARLRATARRLMARLAALDPARARDARGLVAGLERRAAACVSTAPVPVHGSFGLGRVHYGVDSCFYLDLFAGSRCSHPAIDLGAFLADLACLPALAGDADALRAGWEASRDAYLSAGGERTGLADVPVFAAISLLSRADHRLASPAAGREGEVATILDRVERCLRARDGAPLRID